MLTHVAETIRRHGMFHPGQKVGVAVSGGADSVALLHALVELGPRWALDLMVLHLNHQLRGTESDSDAAFVLELSESLGLRCETRLMDVAQQAADTGDNLEQAARTARRRFFLDLIEHADVDCVATGHSRSDQAETVLGRLLRGAGTAGLAGIRPVNPEGIVRPLIEVNRDDVERFLRERGVRWREDSSNADPRFDRNRLRHQLLPQLAREWNPAIEDTLARLATVAGSEEDYWRYQLERLSEELFHRRGSAILLRHDQMERLHAAVARRLVRQAIESLKGDLRSIDFNHVEQVLDLLLRQKADGQAAVPGVEAVRSFDWLRLVRQGSGGVVEDYRLPLSVPGRLRIPGSGLEIHCEPTVYNTENQGYNNSEGCELDRARIPGSLEVRNWKPGDRFQPAGARKERKVKDLFHEERIPSWERVGWPMVISGDTIIWTRRFGVAEVFSPSASTSQVLRIWESGSQG